MSKTVGNHVLKTKKTKQGTIWWGALPACTFTSSEISPVPISPSSWQPGSTAVAGRMNGLLENCECYWSRYWWQREKGRSIHCKHTCLLGMACSCSPASNTPIQHAHLCCLYEREQDGVNHTVRPRPIGLKFFIMGAK